MSTELEQARVLNCARSWMFQWLQDAGMSADVAKDRLAEFERLVRAETVEACALIADNYGIECWTTADDIAEDIRALAPVEEEKRG